jgi:hypothetical protein
MTSIIKCFSILIASGNGDRCQELRNRLKERLHSYDKDTQQYKVYLIKFGQKEMPEDHKRVSKEVFSDIRSLFKDVDDHFFAIDRRPKSKQLSN